MKNFTFVKPKNFRELLEIKNDKKENCLILAGGTNLYVYLKDRLFTEGMITDITGLEEVHGIRLVDGFPGNRKLRNHSFSACLRCPEKEHTDVLGGIEGLCQPAGAEHVYHRRKYRRFVSHCRCRTVRCWS